MTNPDLGRALGRLHALACARKDGDPEQSYTAKLLAGGREKIAKKVGEEAVETALAAVSADRSRIAEESADLLYHLCVLWAACDVTPAEVADILDRRESVGGLAEKAARSS